MFVNLWENGKFPCFLPNTSINIPFTRSGATFWVGSLQRFPSMWDFLSSQLWKIDMRECGNSCWCCKKYWTLNEFLKLMPIPTSVIVWAQHHQSLRKSHMILGLLWLYSGNGDWPDGLGTVEYFVGSKSHSIQTIKGGKLYHRWSDAKPYQPGHTSNTIGHVNNIPTTQFFTGISRNTQSNSYMLSLTECVWKLQWKIALWDTH